VWLCSDAHRADFHTLAQFSAQLGCIVFSATSLFDIAGQVTASSAYADKVTVGGVMLPSGGIKKIRSLIPASFPKWRDASDGHVEFMISLVLRESLSVCAASVDKTTDEWRTFWEDASDTHSRTASIEGGSIGFLKAATMVKFLLFGHSSAAAFGHAVYTGNIPRTIGRSGSLEVSESVVIDNEIQGQDNREALVEIWRSTNAHQPLTNSLGVQRTAKTLQLATEQTEPLLLMADYVAGVVHATHSQINTLSRSLVTTVVAENAYGKLSDARKFLNFTGSVHLRYFDIYPGFKHFSRRHAP
jgi:hypothetical protein